MISHWSTINLVVQAAREESIQPWAIFMWLGDKIVAPVVGGAILAWIGGSIIAKAAAAQAERREYRAEVIEELRESLKSLRELATAYWLKCHDANCSPAEEAEIEYRLKELAALTDMVAPELWDNQQSKGPILVAAVAAEIVTPEFGTPSRAKDPARPRAIGQAVATLTRELLAVRQRV